jgi:hypothetical protein
MLHHREFGHPRMQHLIPHLTVLLGATSVAAGLPYRKFRDAIFTRPIMAEVLGPLFENTRPRFAQAGLNRR